MVDFLYGAPKTCQLFKVSVVLPPSGKMSAGAHGRALNQTIGALRGGGGKLRQLPSWNLKMMTSYAVPV